MVVKLRGLCLSLVNWCGALPIKLHLNYSQDKYVISANTWEISSTPNFLFLDSLYFAC